MRVCECAVNPTGSLMRVLANNDGGIAALNGKDFQSFKLKERRQVSPDTKLYRQEVLLHSLICNLLYPMTVSSAY